MNGEITLLLRAASSGDDKAIGSLFEIVYEELRARARSQLSGSAPQTLSATALVHEAYLKLTSGEIPQWNDRAHFYGIAATAMRHIAIDHARARLAKRRGGGAGKIDIDFVRVADCESAESLIALESALDALATRSERLAKLVELRFFAGLSVEESAAALSTSPRTVKRDWRAARAFIYSQLSGTDDTDAPTD